MQTQTIFLSTDLSLALSWTSIIVSIFVGLIAICQAYHYYKLNDKSSAIIEQSVSKINDVVIKLEAINQMMHDRVMALLVKTVGQLTKGNQNSLTDGLKKDIEKSISESADKLDGQMKEVVNSVGQSQHGINDIRESLRVVAGAVQDVINVVINKTEDDFIHGEHSEIDYVKNKIIDQCRGTGQTTVKSVCNLTSPKIPCLTKLKVIQTLKLEKIIKYDGEELFDSTLIIVESQLEVPFPQSLNLQ